MRGRQRFLTVWQPSQLARAVSFKRAFVSHRSERWNVNILIPVGAECQKPPLSHVPCERRPDPRSITEDAFEVNRPRKQDS